MRIRNRAAPNQLSKHLQWRKEFLAAVQSFDLANTEPTVELLESVSKQLEPIRDELGSTDRVVAQVVECLTRAFIALCNWAQALLNAQPDAARWILAARGQAVLASDLVSPTRFSLFREAVMEAVSLINNIQDLAQIQTVAGLLARIPIPVLQFAGNEESRRYIAPEPDRGEAEQDEGPFVIKVMFQIDRKPWSTPQIVLPNTIYDLDALITVPDWPKNSNYLKIDYISTLAPEHYRAQPIRIERPDDMALREFNIHSHIEFTSRQSMFSEPIAIRMRAAFFRERDPEVVIPATIVGYHEIRLRISDPASVPPLARYRSIDERIVEMLEEIQQANLNLSPQHLSEFVDALAAITNYMGINLQEAIYREGMKIDERTFQSNLLQHMRRRLGEDVQEAPRQGGGPMDIKYRSVTIELKVEDKISDRRKMIEKYISQPTQYSSAGGAQLGILCVLDLTEKHHPPANPKNNIALETPTLHGFPEGNAPFPSKIAVVIIDGNLRTPSSYSR